MYHLHTPQSNILTYVIRAVYVIAAIEAVVNVAPPKVTIGLVGAALALVIYDVGRRLKDLLIALTDRLVACIEKAIERHSEIVLADGMRHREVIIRATADHASAIGDKVANLERVAVKVGMAAFQGYMDAAWDDRGTQPFRVVK